MIKRFTYKEFILALGVAVALLVAFILWFNQQPIAHSNPVENTGILAPLLSMFEENVWRKAVVEVIKFF